MWSVAKATTCFAGVLHLKRSFKGLERKFQGTDEQLGEGEG